ncbi:MAG: hypothetical protein HY327_01780 [Chloroflexi bacterium]|nr:hypothetical protein [Chloroflexota bacterium]
MPEFFLLLPILFPIVAVLGATLLIKRLPRNASPWLSLFIYGINLALILLNSAPGTHRAVIAQVPELSFGLALELDSARLILLVLLYFIPVILALVAPPEKLDAQSIAVLAAAGFAILAANPLTMVVALVALDAMLLAWRLTRGVQVQDAARAATTGWIATLIFFAGAAMASSRLPESAAVVIALGAWGRLGLFPFHGMASPRAIPARDLWIARGAPLIAASTLWLSFDAWKIAPSAEWILALSGAGLLAAFLWARRAEEPAPAASAVTNWSVAFIPLAVVIGGDAAYAITFWNTLSVAFGLALFEIALKWRAENRARWYRFVWIAGIFAFAGAPLSPAFLGRIDLLIALWESAQGALFALISITSLFLCISLWRFALGMQAAERRALMRRERLALLAIAGAFVGMTLMPLGIGALGDTLSDSMVLAAQQAFYGTAAGAIIGGWAVVIAPIFMAWGFARQEWRTPTRVDAVLRGTARAFELDWLIQSVGRVAYQVGALARQMLAVAEQNPTLWVLLVALWIAIFILIPR